VKSLVVVDRSDNWSFDIPDVDVVSAREYITRPEVWAKRGVRVFNLCRSYRYQSVGYYVSLLAAARGHKPIPSMATIQDLKSSEVVRIRSDELEGLAQQALKPIKANEFVLSIYFGRNLAKRYERLSAHLFRVFHTPLMRARFERTEDGQWRLVRLSTIAAAEVPEGHKEFVEEAAREYFASPRRRRSKRPGRFDLAILVNPDEAEPPSNPKAIEKFMRAARRVDITPWIVHRDDYARLGEFDALFIRETTNVHHHTFRFALRAQAEGLVVVDDPESILRCTNKVYLAELMDRIGVATPRTVVVHRQNINDVIPTLGLPCILKQPDSAFCQGVMKAENEAEFREMAAKLLDKSELIVAQEYTPTDYDWRVGIFDGEPLFVCKYYMAPKHWQVTATLKSGRRRSGRVEAVPMQDAPPAVVKTALKAARAIGDGLYGADLKQIDKRVLLMEVNDNPSIESPYEDKLLGDGLYDRMLAVFLRRLEARQRGVTHRDHVAPRIDV